MYIEYITSWEFWEALASIKPKAAAKKKKTKSTMGLREWALEQDCLGSHLSFITELYGTSCLHRQVI